MTKYNANRVCTKCNQSKPETEEYFYRRSIKEGGRFQRECKACTLLRTKLHYAKNSSKIKAYQKRYAALNKQRLSIRRHAYYKSNQSELYRKSRAYQLAHVEQTKAHKRKYANRYPDRVKLSKRRYREANRDSIREANRRYAKNNPDKVRQNVENRRARKFNAGGQYTVQDIDRQYRIQNGKCWWCLGNLDRKFNIDHLVPLARGGHNYPSNLVLAHAFCNQSKGSKMPDEFCGRLL